MFDPIVFDDIVDKILTEHKTVFGSTARPQAVSRSVSFRPYSVAARLSFLVDGAERAVWVKIPRKRDLPALEREFALLRHYRDRFGPDGPYGVVEPLACFSVPPCLVTAEGPGLPFKAVIGRNAAVAQLGWLKFAGFLAWLAWLFIHIWYLIGFDNKLVVIFQWAWNYFTRKRGARLITGPDPYPLVAAKLQRGN